jgi:hypothetical protein
MNINKTLDIYKLLDKIGDRLIEEGTHPDKKERLNHTVGYLLEKIDTELQNKNTVVDENEFLNDLKEAIDVRLNEGQW